MTTLATHTPNAARLQIEPEEQDEVQLLGVSLEASFTTYGIYL